MAVSLSSKLAIGLVLLTAILMTTLYTVHKTPSFQTHVRSWEIDTPAAVDRDETNARGQIKREMKEVEQKPFVEDVEEVMEDDEDRGPMNIILFYADDWRHDVSLHRSMINAITLIRLSHKHMTLLLLTDIRCSWKSNCQNTRP